MSTRAAAAPDRRWDYGIVLGLVTPERMASYLGASQGDVERAFARYEWNIEASAGVMGLSSVVEVVVRNAIDRELTTWARRAHGPHAEWFDHAPLDLKGRRDLERARERATRRGRLAEVHGKSLPSCRSALAVPARVPLPHGIVGPRTSPGVS